MAAPQTPNAFADFINVLVLVGLPTGRGCRDQFQGAALQGLVRVSWRLVGDRRCCRARVALGLDRCAYSLYRHLAGRDGDRPDRSGTGDAQ